MNGGFLLCLDGTPDSERRAQQMLHWDVFNGVSRRAWAGNSNALSYTAHEHAENPSFRTTFPHCVSDDVLDSVLNGD